MKLTPLAQPSHEKVLRVDDPASGLTGFIAIHSTALGPAAGGLRMRSYASEADALEDVLRLSRGMSFKNAAADLPLGGGKAVILGDPARKTPEMLRAMGRAIETLGGQYWTAEDMGMSPADMAVIRGETAYVAGLADGPHASGDPSPVTARGIFYAIRRTAQTLWGAPVLPGRRVAIQGLGHVGWHLAKFLRAAGAELIVADRDPELAARAVQSFGAIAVPAEDILEVEADILAPCAIGGILNAATIPGLNVSAVCGGANNQLAHPEDGDALRARGILYAPDYVVNAGGIVNVATEILRIADRDGFVSDKLHALDGSLAEIFARAAEAGVGPHQVADAAMGARLTGQPQAA